MKMSFYKSATHSEHALCRWLLWLIRVKVCGGKKSIKYAHLKICIPRGLRAGEHRSDSRLNVQFKNKGSHVECIKPVHSRQNKDSGGTAVLYEMHCSISVTFCNPMMSARGRKVNKW